MNIKIIVLLIASCFILSCGKKDEIRLDLDWKNKNDAAFEKITNDNNYTKLSSLSKKGFIMFKRIKSGDINSKSPIYTDKVKVKYTGWYKLDWTQQDDISDSSKIKYIGNIPYFLDQNNNKIDNVVIFDTTNKGVNNIEIELNIKDLITGYADALQEMKIGDKWEVWIPYNLGYGLGFGRIKEYTTLVFEIELLEIN